MTAAISIPKKPAMPRPRHAEALPATLTELDQWVCWAWQWDAARCDWTKVPKQPNGANASTTAPETWSTFEDVLAAADRNPDFGVGFVFSKNDSMVGIDLDDCLGQQGRLKPWAAPIVERFGDTYCEVSPSGMGVKIFAQVTGIEGLLAGSGSRKPYHDGAVEIYRHSRFFTVTGNAFNGAPLEVEHHQASVEWLLKLIAVRSARPATAAEVPKLNGDDTAAMVAVLEAAARERRKVRRALERRLRRFRQRQRSRSLLLRLPRPEARLRRRPHRRGIPPEQPLSRQVEPEAFRRRPHLRTGHHRQSVAAADQPQR